jgi:hypothetical protein
MIKQMHEPRQPCQAGPHEVPLCEHVPIAARSVRASSLVA